MSRSGELIKNTAILLVARLATQAVGFFLMPLYTSILSTYEYGEADIYGSLSVILLPFMTLQIEMSLFRYFITEQDEQGKKKIVTSSFCISTFCICSASILYLIVSSVITVKYKYYLLLYYVTMSVITILFQTARAKGDNIGYGIATFISSISAIALNIIFVLFLRWGVRGILIAQIIANVLSSLYILLRTKIYSYFCLMSFSKEKSMVMLRYSTPMIINQISSWTMNYSDRIIILKFLGMEINGIYAVANKFSNVVMFASNMFMVAWTENVIRNMKEDDSEKYYSNVISFVFNICLIGITGIINLLPFVFDWLVNEKFIDSYIHIALLLYATFFYSMASMLGSIYIAYGRTKTVSVTTTIAALIDIGVHIFLIEFVGLYAASISTIVSFFLMFIFRIINVRSISYIKLKISIWTTMIAGFSFFAYVINNKIFIVGCLLTNLANVVYTFLKNKEKILGVIGSIKIQESGIHRDR